LMFACAVIVANLLQSRGKLPDKKNSTTEILETV
jgi:hypothetical protein